MPGVESKLYKDYGARINGIDPLVPSLWTGDPATAGLAPINTCFPDPEAVRCRVADLIKLLSPEAEDKLTTSGGKVLNNPKPLQDLISKKEGAFGCQLVRDYNGEYAPCVAAVLGGALCKIVPGLKPSSMKTTIGEVDESETIKLDGCPEDDAKATAWLLNAISKSKVSRQYYDAEVVKCGALGRGLFEAADLDCTTTETPERSIPMNSLHQYWQQNQIPHRFYSKVADWMKQTNAAAWVRSICLEAPLIHRNKPEKQEKQEHSAPVSDKSSVKPPQPPTFALWIRWQLPKNHSHNMGQDLLLEIVTAIAKVCHHVYPTGRLFRFLLFGDRAAKKTPAAKVAEKITFADMPVHSGGAASAAKTEISDFVADTFNAQWPGEAKPHVMVIDFRDLYNPVYFKTPTLAKFAEAKVPSGPDVKPAAIQKAIEEFRKGNPRKSGYSYWEQYGFFQSIDKDMHPRFIIGAESGNMDGFGYCGIPVISVDVEDAAPTDESIMVDRIGQYCFLTPLWNLLNYHRGAGIAKFRRLLYGSILMYTEYGDGLRRSKYPKSFGKIEVQKDFGTEDKDDFGKLFAGDVASKSHAVEDSLKDTYGEDAVINVEGDGNCLFRALSRVRTGDEDRHLTYRREAVDYAAAHFSLAMIQAVYPDMGTNEDYRLTMREKAMNSSDRLHYGSYLEVEAFALRYGVTVAVYSEDFDHPLVSNAGQDETVRIFYVNRNHYKAIVEEG